jgi:hypothetical protein
VLDHDGQSETIAADTDGDGPVDDGKIDPA